MEELKLKVIVMGLNAFAKFFIAYFDFDRRSDEETNTIDKTQSRIIHRIMYKYTVYRNIYFYISVDLSTYLYTHI